MMRRPSMIIIWLFTLALLVRGVGVVVRREYVPPARIGAEAGVLAESIAAGRGFVSPYDEGEPASASTLLAPVYPYLLAGLLKMGLSLRGVFYVSLGVNLVAGTMLPLIVLWMGRSAGVGERVSRVAAGLMCFCPEAVRAVALVWDEALFATATALIVWWMLRRLRAEPVAKDAVKLGLVSGVLALLNPAMVLALPGAWLAGLQARGASIKKIVVHGGLFALCTVVGSLPWHIRNFFLIDPPAHVFIRGPYWCAAWSSMHPLESYERADGTMGLRALHPWEGTETLNQPMEGGGFTHLTEQQYFDWCKERAMAAFRETPRLLVDHVARQFNSFWLGIAEAWRWHKNPWPFFLAQGAPAILGILGFYLTRKKIPPVALAVFCAMLLVFPLPYYFSDASSRYRHPIDAFIYVGVALLVVQGVESFKKRFQKRDMDILPMPNA